jgi:hypothetical protein
MLTNIEKIRLVLNILFVLGFVAIVVMYFAISDERQPLKQHLIVGTCLGTIFFKIVESALRMHQNVMERNNRRKSNE